MSAAHCYGAGCVLSDGRFAVFAGLDYDGESTKSCEALSLDEEFERWEPLPPMHELRTAFVCAAIGGCVIVAGGNAIHTIVEVYEEALGRWRWLPCNLPHDTGLSWPRGAGM
jgi:hypothetical protein